MKRRTMVRQFLKFNGVGTLGAAVQVGMLRFFTGEFTMHYVIATAVSVEIAVLHNFCWHQMWTWKGLPWRGWPGRLMRFQLSNGAASIVSNTLLTFALRELLSVPVLAANMAAIGITGLINFCLARFWVFRAAEPRCPSRFAP